MRFISIFLLFFIMLQGQVYSQNAQYFTSQGKLYYELQDYEDAIIEFERALQFPNPARELYIYLTSAYLLNGNAEKAVKRAEEGIQLFDGYLRLKVMKGEGLIGLDRKEAIRTFENVYDEITASDEMQLEGIYSENIKNYLSQLYQQEAVYAFDSEDLDTAAYYYKSARNFDRNSLSIHNNLSYILIQQDKFDEAKDAIEYGLQFFPNAENLLLMKAQIFDEKGDQEKLAEVLESLYKTDPENIERTILYGKSILNANQAQKANLFFQEKIKEFPKERALYRALIDINRQRFNQSGLLQVLSLKKDQFPDDLEILEEYGLELITARRYKDANAFFDSLATEYQKPEYAQLANHAFLYNGEYELAEKEYRKQLNRWPQHAEMLREYGLLLIKNKKFEEAKEVMERFLRDNENGRIRIQYAMLINDLSKREEILKPLGNTVYQGQANWVLVGDTAVRDKEFYQSTLIRLIKLYDERQEEVQEEAQFGLSQFRAPNPPLLQIAVELDEIKEQLRDLLVYIQKRLPFNVAVEILEMSLMEYPSSALLYHYKGLLYFNNDDLDSALDNLVRAAELQAENEETHLYLGHINSAFDQFEQASLFYERVLSISKENRDAYQSLIRLSQKHDKLDDLCNRWLQRYKNERDNQILKEFLIEALHRANRFEEAKELISSE